MPTKLARTAGYDSVHIDKLLNVLSHNQQDYLVVAPITKNIIQSEQQISDTLRSLNDHPEIPSVVIPINLGDTLDEIWDVTHWVGLSITRTDTGYKVIYTDFCVGNMDSDLPSLRQILNSHNIRDIMEIVHIPYQTNVYDCGPWTVFNLDSLARTGKLSPTIDDNAIKYQRSILDLLLQDQQTDEVLFNTSGIVSSSVVTTANLLGFWLTVQAADQTTLVIFDVDNMIVMPTDEYTLGRHSYGIME